MNRMPALGLVRVVMLLGFGLLAVLFFAAPPQSIPRLTQAAPIEATEVEAKEVVEVTTIVGPRSGTMVTPLEMVAEIDAVLEADLTGRVHWTSKSVEVHIGPNKGYVVIGQLPRAARLQVVGRDESSKWVGIVFSPYTGLTGWIRSLERRGAPRRCWPRHRAGHAAQSGPLGRRVAIHTQGL